MGYMPIFVEAAGRKCVVIGGGEVAARKIESLVEAEAIVTVISPHLVDSLARLVERGAITHRERTYRRGDLNGCMLAYAAIGDDSATNHEIAEEARELGILLNVADVPELCTFIAPAVVRQGALQIAVSTSGASPAMAAKIRRKLEREFGVEYGLTLRILRGARTYLKSQKVNAAGRAKMLKALAESELPAALELRDLAAIERIVATCLGDGVGLSTIGIDLQSLGMSNGLNLPR